MRGEEGGRTEAGKSCLFCMRLYVLEVEVKVQS